jgi:hypothetical protein
MSASSFLRGGVTLIAMTIALQVMWVQQGYSQVAAPRVVTADETTGLVHDFTSAMDSGFGPVCATANEDLAACFGTPYDVSSALINPAFVANGGIVGVNLCDTLGDTCALDGRNTSNTISDQLYLSVGAQNAAAATNSLTWCWDSDLEPNVNVCQDQITVSRANLSLVLEPDLGFTDLTRFFVGVDATGGPLLAGAWQVQARSEAPEPDSSLLLAASVVGLIGYGWRRRKQGS